MLKIRILDNEKLEKWEDEFKIYMFLYLRVTNVWELIKSSNEKYASC